METDFIIVITGQIITIRTDSNVRWNCYASGNFTLSKNHGIGSTTINIIAPPSVTSIDGYVEFVVNGLHCSSKYRRNINGETKDTFSVTPLNIYFTKSGDNSNVSVTSTKSWEILNDSIDTNKISISNITDNGFTINSIKDGDYSTYIIVSNDSQTKTINIYQKPIVDDTCLLEVIKSPSNADASVFQLSITSKKGNEFSTYTIKSKPANINLNDDRIGIIKGNVIDLFKDAKGDIVITNGCGAEKRININYSKKIDGDDIFYIYHNPDKYTEVNISYEANPITWNGNNIILPYNENYTFDIVSKDNNDNNVSWYTQTYNNEIIEISTTQNKLTLKLIDYNKLDIPETIVLVNNNNKTIILTFKVADGLIESNEYKFEIGLTEGNKSKNVSTNYENSGVTVYIDSYLTLSSTPNIKWICASNDEIARYDVAPNSNVGGYNNKVLILASNDVLNGLEDDYVGRVKFQQMETYEYIYVDIKHKATEKKWVEKSHETTAMTISPSSVSVPPCKDERSDSIIVTSFVKIVEQLKDTNGNIYGERTRYSELDVTNIVTWNNPSTDLGIIRDGASLYVIAKTANKYGGNDRIVKFTLSEGGMSNTLTAIQDTASQSEIYKVMKAELASFDFKLAPIKFERIGGVSLVTKYAIVDFYSYMTDSCGNINYDTERKSTENFDKELTVKKVSGTMISVISADYLSITVKENPWQYEFKLTEVIEELHFADRDTPSQDAKIKTHRNCPELKGDFVSEFYTVKEGVEITKTSDIVSLTQSGGEEITNYTVLSKPDWVIAVVGTVGADNISNLTVNVEKNTVKEERIGYVVIKQNESGKEITIKIRQDARGIIPIPDFNYLVFRYMWAASGGKDLDTATVFVNTGVKETREISGGTETFTLDNNAVGFGNGGIVPPSDYPAPVTIVKGLSDNIYLEFGGDNRESGKESVWINFLEVCNEHNIEELPEEIYADIYAIWWTSRDDGNIQVEISAYKGGVMIKDPEDKYNFINEGGELVYNSIQGTNVANQGSSKTNTYKTDYSYIARVTYFKETQSAILQIL